MNAPPRHTCIGTSILLALATSVILFGSGVCLSAQLPTGEEVGPIQFDAIVELSASRIGQHATLFVRYWVTSDAITLGIIWTEPHIPTAYFPLYPVTLTMSTNKERFRVSSQTDPLINATLAKPINPRGVFRYMFGDYPVTNLSVAEREALSTRLYRDDFREISKKPDPNGLHKIDLSQGKKAGHPDRSVAKAKARVSAGQLTSLDLLDGDERLLKNVRYDYGTDKGDPRLRQQKVSLPEMTIPVGLQSGSIQVTRGEKKRTYTEFESNYRQGGRECIVDYAATAIGDKRAVMPTKIGVRNASTGLPLRGAHLVNFKPFDGKIDKIEEIAKEACHFGSKIQNCRRVAVKYWLKDPGIVTEEDRNTLKMLETHFTRCETGTQAVGEELRRINMLLQITWVLGDKDQLARHFQTYLEMLQSHDLGRVIMLGGRHVIDTTILWGYFDAADAMLSKWAKKAVASNDSESILRFGHEELANRRFWTLIRLMEETAVKYEGKPAMAFETRALRCMALCQLCGHLSKPEALRREIDIMQVGWVSRSTNAEAALDEARTCYAKAERAFRTLSHPTEAQLATWATLENGDEILAQSEATK